MHSNNGLRKLKSGFMLKDWMIAVAGILAVKECIIVTVALNQLLYPAGILAGVIFISIASFGFSQLYEKLPRGTRAGAFLFFGLTLALIISNGGAAHAQFLNNAETFFTEGAASFGLGDSIDLLISLIFWLIRGAFVIGVAIALLPAIQAAREGEEWRSLAKTPMLVVGIVLAGATSVDFLTTGVGG